MKRISIVVAIITWLVMVPLFALAGYGSSGDKPSNAAAAFGKLKSLAGTWDTTTPDGGPATVTWAVVSNGTAVMETISHKAGPDMVTMYTVDGDELMLTHYSVLGNQPRMRAIVPSGDIKELNFEFVDGTNMTKNDRHMHKLKLAFFEDGNVMATWAPYENGKPVGAVQMGYVRSR